MGRMTYKEVKDVLSLHGVELISKEYKNTTTPINMICKCGKPFSKIMKIMKKSGLYMCNECVLKRQAENQMKPYEEVKKLLEERGFALCVEKNEYKGLKYKYLVECKNGHKRQQVIQDIISGHNCKVCASIENGKKQSHSFEYIKEYIENFNYKLLSKECDYKNSYSHITVQCDKNHSEYCVSFDNFRGGARCPHCYNEKRGRSSLVPYSDRCEYVESFGYKIITSEDEYVDASHPIEVMCDKGHIYTTNLHGFRNGYRCTKCNISKGEMLIESLLKKNNIIFETQHTFDDCKFKRVLLFDFYLPKQNTLIEYDGRQHFEIVKAFGGLEGFIDTKIRDTIKNEYCKNNNIKLIRIPYWEFDNIENILLKNLII